MYVLRQVGSDSKVKKIQSAAEMCLPWMIYVQNSEIKGEKDSCEDTGVVVCPGHAC